MRWRSGGLVIDRVVLDSLVQSGALMMMEYDITSLSVLLDIVRSEPLMSLPVKTFGEQRLAVTALFTCLFFYASCVRKERGVDGNRGKWPG